MLASKLLGSRDDTSITQHSGEDASLPGEVQPTTDGAHTDPSAGGFSIEECGIVGGDDAREHGGRMRQAMRRDGGEIGNPGEEGGGSERAVERGKGDDVRIVAIDLQEMAPIEGVMQLQVGCVVDRRCGCSDAPKGRWTRFS